MPVSEKWPKYLCLKISFKIKEDFKTVSNSSCLLVFLPLGLFQITDSSATLHLRADAAAAPTEGQMVMTSLILCCDSNEKKHSKLGLR